MMQVTNNFHNKNQYGNKPRITTRSRFLSELPNFGSLVFGILIGVFATSLVVFLFSPTAITLKIPTSGSANLKTIAPITPVTIDASVTEPEPQFDFYSELTKSSVDAVLASTDLNSPAKPINGYLVQAGIFKKSSNADAIKAKLTLNGFQAKIEQIRLADGEIRHRIVLGPFKTEQQAQIMQKKLKAQGIDGIVKTY